MNDLITKYYVQATMKIEEFKQDQRGVTAIEYGLIAVAVAGIVAIAFATFKTDLATLFGKVTTAIGNAA